MSILINKLSKILMILVLLLCLPLARAQIAIVAAENFYGNIAKQLGGAYVDVNSILSNPNQDPHLFSAAPSTARALEKADIIVYNGVDYDPWMITLINAQVNSKRQIIDVADLVGIKSGANPHIWYNPKIMMAYARRLTSLLIQLDPVHRGYYEKQLNSFIRQNTVLIARINTLKQKTRGLSVIATEPVFGYMADLLGFNMQGLAVQWEIMNDATPSPKEIRDYEDKLIHKQVRLLFYNNQVTDPLTDQIKILAQQQGIPIIGISETQPLHFKTYTQWMNAELDTIKTQLQ